MSASLITQLYIGYYNRAPDPAGLSYWIDIAKTQSITQIAEFFAQQTESKANYPYLSAPNVADPNAFVNQIYLNLFNRAATDADKAYWVGQLQSGKVSVGAFIATIQFSANSAGTGDDFNTLKNKATVGLDYATKLANTGTNFTQDSAKDVVSGVTKDAATVAAGTAKTDAFIAGGGGAAQTFTLTVNQDNYTGGNGNDNFNSGVVVDPGTGNARDTLQNFDQLTGGAGTDSLNVTLNGAAAITPTLSSVELINLRSTNAGSGINLSASTGVQKVTVANSTATAVIQNAGALASIGIANQNSNVSLTGTASTATTLALAFDKAGVVSATAPTQVVLDLGAAAASVATTLNLTTNASNVEVKDSTGTSIATTVTVAATGANTLKLTNGASTIQSLTTTGTGSVDVSSVNLSALKTLTAGDGGIKAVVTNATATAVTATSGAGDDTLTFSGAGVKSVTTGGGKDSVTITTGALAATASIDLGAGDDTLTFTAAPTGGATLNGGDGTDTFAVTTAIYGTVSGFSTANLAKITNFETLGITDALTDAAAYDVSKIAGITNFSALSGVTATKTATVTNLGANATVTLAGDLATNNGTISLAYKTDTTTDVLNLTARPDYTDNNDTTADAIARTVTVSAANIETINFTSTGKINTFTPVTGYKADVVTNTLALTDDQLVTLNVSGDQKASFTSAAGMTKLATIDASANTAGVTINASAATGTSPALTIKGTAKADVVTGGANGDTITLGAGNDTVDFSVGGASKIGTGKFDTITDFAGNTFGNGTNGAAGTGAGAAASWTGDVLKFTGDGGAGGVVVDVFTNAANATTFLANNAATAAGLVAALDSSTGNLYVDNTNDGVADYFIQLTGVTTITAASFTL